MVQPVPSAGLQHPWAVVHLLWSSGSEVRHTVAGMGHKNISNVLYGHQGVMSSVLLPLLKVKVLKWFPWILTGVAVLWAAWEAVWWTDMEGHFLICRGGQNLLPQCLLGFGLFDLASVAAPKTRDEELPRKRMLPGDISWAAHKSSTEPCCPGQLPPVVGPGLICCAVSMVAVVSTRHGLQPCGLRLFLIWCCDWTGGFWIVLLQRSASGGRIHPMASQGIAAV